MLLLPNIVDHVFALDSQSQDKLFRFTFDTLKSEDFQLVFWSGYVLNNTAPMAAAYLQSLSTVWGILLRHVANLDEQNSVSLLSLHLLNASLAALLQLHGMREGAVHLHSYRQSLIFSFQAEDGRTSFTFEDHVLKSRLNESFFEKGLRHADTDFDLLRYALNAASICGFIVDQRLIGLPESSLHFY